MGAGATDGRDNTLGRPSTTSNTSVTAGAGAAASSRWRPCWAPRGTPPSRATGRAARTGPAGAPGTAGAGAGPTGRGRAEPAEMPGVGAAGDSPPAGRTALSAGLTRLADPAGFAGLAGCPDAASAASTRFCTLAWARRALACAATTTARTCRAIEAASSAGSGPPAGTDGEPVEGDGRRTKPVPSASLPASPDGRSDAPIGPAEPAPPCPAADGRGCGGASARMVSADHRVGSKGSPSNSKASISRASTSTTWDATCSAVIACPPSVWSNRPVRDGRSRGASAVARSRPLPRQPPPHGRGELRGHVGGPDHRHVAQAL